MAAETNPQKTISREITLEGVGLHSGQISRITLQPAAGANEGINWQRIDLVGRPTVKACPAFCQSFGRNTALVSPDCRIETIEHVMAALAGLKLDNVRILLDGPEPPILDGSCLPFIEALKTAGIEEQAEDKKLYRLDKPLVISEEGGELIAVPSPDLKITYLIDYPSTIVGRQVAIYKESDDFIKNWAPARTFGFWFEVDELKEAGKIKGGSIDNALLVLQDSYSSGLRLPEEPARHKVVDLIGDLKYLGCEVKAHFIALKAGHQLHLKMVRFLAGLMATAGDG